MTTTVTLNLTDWESGECFFAWHGNFTPKKLKQLVVILKAAFPMGETPRKLDGKNTI